MSTARARTCIKVPKSVSGPSAIFHLLDKSGALPIEAESFVRSSLHWPADPEEVAEDIIVNEEKAKRLRNNLVVFLTTGDARAYVHKTAETVTFHARPTCRSLSRRERESKEEPMSRYVVEIEQALKRHNARAPGMAMCGACRRDAWYIHERLVLSDRIKRNRHRRGEAILNIKNLKLVLNRLEEEQKEESEDEDEDVEEVSIDDENTYGLSPLDLKWRETALRIRHEESFVRELDMKRFIDAAVEEIRSLPSSEGGGERGAEDLRRQLDEPVRTSFNNIKYAFWQMRAIAMLNKSRSGETRRRFDVESPAVVFSGDSMDLLDHVTSYSALNSFVTLRAVQEEHMHHVPVKNVLRGGGTELPLSDDDMAMCMSWRDLRLFYVGAMEDVNDRHMWWALEADLHIAGALPTGGMGQGFVHTTRRCPVLAGSEAFSFHASYGALRNRMEQCQICLKHPQNFSFTAKAAHDKFEKARTAFWAFYEEVKKAHPAGKPYPYEVERELKERGERVEELASARITMDSGPDYYFDDRRKGIVFPGPERAFRYALENTKHIDGIDEAKPEQRPYRRRHHRRRNKAAKRKADDEGGGGFDLPVGSSKRTRVEVEE